MDSQGDGWKSGPPVAPFWRRSPEGGWEEYDGESGEREGKGEWEEGEGEGEAEGVGEGDEEPPNADDEESDPLGRLEENAERANSAQLSQYVGSPPPWPNSMYPVGPTGAPLTETVGPISIRPKFAGTDK